MNVPDRLFAALLLALETSLADEDAVHDASVKMRAELDAFIEKSARQRADKAVLIDQLKRLRERDPHAARTPLPPPPLRLPPIQDEPPFPPGARPHRLTPPPRPGSGPPPKRER